MDPEGVTPEPTLFPLEHAAPLRLWIQMLAAALLAVGTRTGYLALLCLSFLSFKVGIMLAPTLYSGHEG